MEYCEVCGSIITDGICSNRRCATRNEALASWIIDGTLWRFKVPLTRAEAIEAIKDKADVVVKVKPPPNRFCKMPTW